MSARVVITGAASGIGAATMSLLEDRGARVVGLDLAPGGENLVRCDVRDGASVEMAVAAAVDRLGGVDVLVNCAGVGDPQSAGEAPGEDAVRVLDVNLLGTWRVTAAALPELRSARGRVVNVASGLAHLTVPLATAYTMSKRGVVAYSDSLRLEHGDAITVTTVYPGYVRTPIHEVARRRGVALEGLVPVESIDAAARTLVRAALGRPARDLATTRRGAVSYALLRTAPRRVVDRLVLAAMRRAIRRGQFAAGDGIAAGLRDRILRSSHS